MGVTFHCPNGHLVRAKESLAGKLGVCPDCGAKVRIPQPGASDEIAAEAALPATAVPAPAPAKSEKVSDVETVLHAGPVLSADDPIDQAPAAAWYVRPPGGEQYGPASGDEIRQWLREGRVPASALVWREGWTEWQPAGATFPPSASERWAGGVVAPAARAGAPADGAPFAPVTIPIVTTDGDAIGSRVRRTLQRRKTERRALLWLVSLGLVSIVVLAALILVLMR